VCRTRGGVGALRDFLSERSGAWGLKQATRNPASPYCYLTSSTSMVFVQLLALPVGIKYVHSRGQRVNSHRWLRATRIRAIADSSTGTHRTSSRHEKI